MAAMAIDSSSRMDVWRDQQDELSDADLALEGMAFRLEYKTIGAPRHLGVSVEQRLSSLVNAARARVKEMQHRHSPHAEIIKVIENATREVRALGDDFDRQSREYHDGVRRAQETSQAISNAIGNLALPALGAGVGAAIGAGVGVAYNLGVAHGTKILTPAVRVAQYGVAAAAETLDAVLEHTHNIHSGVINHRTVVKRELKKAMEAGDKKRIIQRRADVKRVFNLENRVNKTCDAVKEGMKEVGNAFVRKAPAPSSGMGRKAVVAAAAVAGAVVGGAVVVAARAAGYTLGSTSVADATLRPKDLLDISERKTTDE